MSLRTFVVLALTAAFIVEAELCLTEVQLSNTTVKAAVTASKKNTSLLRKTAQKAEPAPLVGDPAVHADWDYAPGEDPAVVEKYTKAESVQSTLFVMACKAKHKNDIDGMARDAAKKDSFNEQQFQDYVKKLQDANIQDMKDRCGKINAKYAQGCMADCTARWAKGGSFSLQKEKKRCVDRCNKKHTDWEAECALKVDELANVFVQEQGNLANTKKCQQIHCKAFPAVLMMKDDEAEDAVKDGCKDMCTDGAIKARCVKRWGLNMDTMMSQWQDECNEDTKGATLDPCVEKGTGDADGELTTCKDEGHGKCQEEADKCLSDAKAGGEDTMVAAHADSICGVRKNVCDQQVDGGCTKDHKKALDKMQKECTKEHKEKSKECLDGKLKEGEDKFKTECFDEIEPKCKEDCEEDCKIPEMRTCQEDMIKKAFAITEEYCTKLWQWVFDSEQLDKKTMDPLPKAEAGGRFKTIARNKLR